MTTRHRSIHALAVVLALAVMVACSSMSRWSAAGTYVREDRRKDFIELKSDGTCFVQEGSNGLTGKYEIDGNQITLKFDIGLAIRGRMDGKTIIDPDGDRWTKGIEGESPVSDSAPGRAPDASQGEPADEAVAIAALRAINRAQSTFAATCGNGFFSPDLVNLGTAPPGGPAFIDSQLGSAKTVVRGGYSISMGSSVGPAASAPESCNGLAAGLVTQGYHATATPLPGKRGRHFGTNVMGMIHASNDPLQTTDTKSSGTPIQ